MTREELGALIIASERQMYATSKTILKNDEDCADAIQDTIVKAFSKIDSLKKDKYAKTWLIRILINECYNIARKNSRFALFGLVEEEADIKADEDKDYSELYLAIDALNNKLKVPVILYYVEDFSIKEIARVLEISEGAVQKRLARARAKLKVKLEHMEVVV